MKITAVELHPHGYSESVMLSFRDPSRSNPYNVKALVGLDADDIVPRHYGGAEKYYTLSLEKRDVIVRIALNPRFNLGETYSSLRDFLYKIISSSRTGQIHIHFFNGIELVSGLSGFISKVEAPHSNKEPEVQITVSCDDPMLRAMVPVSVDVLSLDPALTDITDPVSTAPHGFSFELSFVNPLASFSMTDPTETGWTFTVTPVGGFLAGDVLHFSSEYNNKHLYVVRGATTIYMADVIASNSVWPILFPGSNPFAIANPTNVDWVSISHYPTYWGV